MATIKLPHNQFVLVDDADFVEFSRYNWCLTAGYPSRRKNYKLVYLHHEIMGKHPGKEVDHINGNKLDARRSNLRIVSHQANIANRPVLNKNNKSGYRGVSWFKLLNKWRVCVKVQGKQKTLGYFSDLKEAAKVSKAYYEKAA